jgi:predicted RNA-binding protein with PIN domain
VGIFPTAVASEPRLPGAAVGDDPAGGTATGPGEVVAPEAAVPEHLLVPLLEAAADTLRGLDAAEVPAALRHLHGFDRRGLLHGPAPRQLRRTFADDAGFRAAVVERFRRRPEVEAVLARWSSGAAAEIVAGAQARHDLPVLASVLWACAPEGAGFGLGLAVAADAEERRARGEEEAAQARARELHGLEEARRRADAARLTAEAEAARAEEALRDERRARRAREERAEQEARAAQRRADELGARLAEVEAALEAERSRLAREGERRGEVEDEVRRLRAELTRVADEWRQRPSALDARDARALADAAGAAHQLAMALEALRRRVAIGTRGGAADDATGRRDGGGERTARTPPAGATGGAEGTPPRAPARRVRPRLPAGMSAESPAGIEAMLRTNGVLVVVDGYNVSQRGWPEATAADQRERLAVALAGLHRRLACEVCCVFDGDGSGPEQVVRGRGVRVLFSDADEEADDVVVRVVADQPKRVPVVVVSSDAWVREHAEAHGAVVVGSDGLLGLLRPAR